MALQSSGPISFADLQTEFGGTNPISLSEYYRGAGLVPDAAQNSAVAASGAIALGQFYNAVNRIPINITLSANQTNYVLNTAKAAGYVAGISDIVLTINSGVYVSSNTTAGYALDVDTSWAAGDTITIVNNGFIVGRGGNGGRAPAFFGNGSAGSSGGAAFRTQRPITINNTGTIAGGGGGGGGGAGIVSGTGYFYSSYIQAGGGGGGGGRSSQAANSTGGATSSRNADLYYPGSVGGSGTAASAGSFGAGAGARSSDGWNAYGANGGSGGDWGSSGANGGSYGPYSGGGGASAGAAISGNSNITWTATGTRLGAIA